MTHLSRRNTIALLAACNILLVGVGWFVLIAPQRRDAASLARSATETETQIAAARARIAAASLPNASAAPAQPVIRTADLYQLAKAMPPTVDMPDLLLELDQVARAAGVKVQSIAPSAPTPGTPVGVVSIDVTFTGDFYAVSDMLFRLRTLVSVRRGALAASGRLFSVGALSLAPSGGGRTLSVTATIDAYLYDAAAAPPASTTAPGASGATTTTGTTTTAPYAAAAP